MTARPRRRPGRPTKLDARLHAELVRLLRAGHYLETAAHLVGLEPKTLRDWLQRGARARGVIDEDYARLAAEVRRAQAEAEARDVVRIGRSKDWRATAWRLERRFPRRWGPKIQLQVEQALDAFLAHLEGTLDASTYTRVLEAARAWDGEAGPVDGEE